MPATALIVHTLGASCLSCGRGCVGGGTHDANVTCNRGLPADVRMHNGFCMSVVAGRWKLLQSSLDVAEVWEIRESRADSTIGLHYCIVGPSLPGTILGISAAGNWTARTLETAKVVRVGAAWIPLTPFMGISVLQWTRMAASTCAWRRLVHQKPAGARPAGALTPPHTAAAVNGYPVEQDPPMYTRGKRTVVCCYCKMFFGNVSAYADSCAPDASICAR